LSKGPVFTKGMTMQEKIAAIRKHTALLREETQQKQQALGQMKIEKEKAAQE
jgi:hypothetical protein